MQAVYSEVDGGALSCLHNLFLDLFAYFCHNFLDACGVYASVGHKLMQGQTGYLAAYGVEARKHDGVGGVIDNYLDAGGGFEGADVAAFTTDYAAFYVVGVYVKYRD